MIGYIVVPVVLYYGYQAYINRISDNDRAAETFPIEIEKKTPMRVKASSGRPAVTRGNGYVASAFNNAQGYTPIMDIPYQNAEGEMKVLNINRRFLYG